MKILFHHRTISADGQAIHIDELTSALRNRGHEVIVIGPGGREDRRPGQDDGMVKALRRYLPRALYELLEISYSLVAYRRLKTAYRRHRPDILYERANLFLPVGVRLKRRYELLLPEGQFSDRPGAPRPGRDRSRDRVAAGHASEPPEELLHSGIRWPRRCGAALDRRSPPPARADDLGHQHLRARDHQAFEDRAAV